MRHITEANAKVIEEVLEEHYKQLREQSRNSRSLRLQNKVRLLYIAITELKTNKTTMVKTNKTTRQ